MGFKKPNTKDDFEPLEEIAPGVDFSYDFPAMPKKKEDDHWQLIESLSKALHTSTH